MFTRTVPKLRAEINVIIRQWVLRMDGQAYRYKPTLGSTGTVGTSGLLWIHAPGELTYTRRTRAGGS